DHLFYAPEALLEIISDPTIDTRAASRNALQDLLTALVDLSFSMPGFPSQRYLELYISLAEALVYVKGTSAAEEDAHLLHGLFASIANLSPDGAHRCGVLLRTWWRTRPVLARVDWLLSILESIAALTPDPNSLSDLWWDAFALITRKQIALGASRIRIWENVAGLLELDPTLIETNLSPLRSRTIESNDLLTVSNWKKIAIVSLQERAAREAARELQTRTGADVFVVSNLVQDNLTKTAQTADLILLVWAACSHAVYRAFDDCRDRVAYVQGTGTSSIIASAERWAEKTRVASSLGIRLRGDSQKVFQN
ncbi:MAG: hypothetical protein EB072_20025, partial [Betaproteobacteria bacterium]|nr:hypothetical protein [Betaproteobacteria bacterium]